MFRAENVITPAMHPREPHFLLAGPTLSLVILYLVSFCSTHTCTGLTMTSVCLLSSKDVVAPSTFVSAISG